MKVSLVVASGSHQGKVIPINIAQFLIGREPQCNLRPASQAISKKHCGIITREGRVFVIDFGSTNGTLVNDTLIKDEEVEVEDGALVMVGPLDFTLRIEKETADTDGTPFPAQPDALAAVKAVSATAKAAGRDNTPAPATPTAKPAVSTGSKEVPALTGSKESPALKAAAKPAAKPESPAAKPTPTPAPAKPSPKIAAPSAGEQSEDELAAMLLGMDDGEEVPDGSTVMEMPSMLAQDTKTGAPAPKPADDKNKKATSREEMTNVANDLLRKMRRRPS